jgi:hypothetical protein
MWRRADDMTSQINAPSPNGRSCPFGDADFKRCYPLQTSTCGDQSGTLVVSFAGQTQGAGAIGTGFFPASWGADELIRVPFEFVGVCERVGARALHVRDPLQRWYMRADAADPYASLLEYLRREIAMLRPTRLVTIGASMGGYAAIRAGLALRADAILAFAPQVSLDPSDRAGLPAMFFDDQLSVLRAEASAAGFAAEPAFACWQRELALGDLTHGELTCRAPTTCIEVHVGSTASSDVMEARQLKEAVEGASDGRTRVGVHVHAGSGHGVAKDLRDAGRIDALLGSVINESCASGRQR